MVTENDSFRRIVVFVFLLALIGAGFGTYFAVKQTSIKRMTQAKLVEALPCKMKPSKDESECFVYADR
jgi:disulfide bond formation protein DsbB